MTANPARLMIAGTGSGCGKTTVTCALLGALKARGLAVASFKCGPDYIDPMFHSEILGTPSRNLDLFLMGEKGVRYSLAENGKNADISVVEGVMGFYDGAGQTASYSSCHLANIIQAPVVLTVSCKGMSLTVCALLKGMEAFLPNRIAGVILNQVSSKKMFTFYREMIEANTPFHVYGYFPPMPEATLGSRHLGLITAAEVDALKQKLSLLAEQAERTVDLDGLLQLSWKVNKISYEPILPRRTGQVRVGVARDKAFCFYYEDSMQLISQCGAELVPFSPLADKRLPEGLNGLILGGGYPELYLKQLSANESMRRSIWQAWHTGMPVFAECGGFQYLQKAFVDDNGTAYPLAGCIDSESRMTKRLCRFGYVKLTAQKDTLLCRRGEEIPAHEFHYGDSSLCGEAFVACKESNGAEYPCIVAEGNLFAGYPHLHLYGNPAFAERFVRACAAYRRGRTNDRGESL